MHEDEDLLPQATSVAISNAQAESKRYRLWLVGILLVAGSCMLAIVHLSSGLHVQLLGNRRMVRALKEQLLEEGKERESLLRDKDVSMGKTSTLRSKSKLVTEELLDQQRKSRRLSQELLLAREDLTIATKNCTLSNMRMKNRYEVTLRALHDRVVSAEECRALLGRNLEERAMLESSLVLMQDRAYNASKLVKIAKQKLKEALQIASAQRAEIDRLKAELASSSSSSSWFSSSSDSAAATVATDDTGAAAAVAESSIGDSTATLETQSQQEEEPSSEGESPLPAGWKEYTDEKSGKKYWYNAETKKSQWEKP